ncbi:phosphatidylinositol-4-phosphate-5-kinase (PI-PIPK-B) [Thraustotheca clavata]|uniref:Phosphatidylinositol-4-phosphate-5-kinase (PI-PIPK-B) n=1 Tax=Thraustotheca clavata TaxID=74557 RepID=A0A1W0AAQ5_9STRA|nr:phosphatidylinositol-4-phosphate-5-kinase (PI-PIPK-B) [Thraustotheca clavata]
MEVERIPRLWSEEGMETVVEEVFEVQTIHPYKFPIEWRTDTRRWLDRTGNIPISLFCTFPTTFNPAADNEMGDEQKHYWRWNHPWVVDPTYTTCDVDGWTYGTSISAINKHLAKGTSRSKRHPQDFVRRRRWIRMRIKLTTCQLPKSQHTYDEDTRYYRSLRVDSMLSHMLHCRSTPINHMQNMTFDKKNIVMEGWLGKCGSYSHTWKLRYFILRDDFNTLVYLKDLNSLLQLGQVYINGHTSVFAIKHPPNSKLRNQFAFEILNGKTRLRLNAPSAPTRSDWMAAISSMIINRRSSFMMGDGDEIPLADGSFHKNKPKAWQPYSLIVSSTIREMPHNTYVETCYVPLVRRLEKVFSVAKAYVIELLTELVDTSNKALEDSRIQKLVAEGILIPEDNAPGAEKLRSQAITAFDRFESDIKNLQSTHSLLEINRVKEELYQECSKIIESMFSFQSTTSTRVVNAKRAQAAANRRNTIPAQWTNPPQITTRPEQDDEMSLIATRLSSSTLSSSTRSSSDAKPMVVSQKREDQESFISQTSHKHHKKDIRQRLREIFDDRVMHLEKGVKDTIVWVHENDFGSLIAYTLLSSMYVQQLEASCQAINVAEELIASTNCMNKATALQILNTSFPNHFKCHVVLRQTNNENTLSSELSHHGEIEDDSHNICCMVYFATQFHALRQICRPGNRAYVESICQSAAFATSGGKSGAMFNLAHDRRFILKGVTAAEFNMFIDFAPEYFKYLSKCFENNEPSCLAKILGAYKLKIPSQGGKWNHVIVMENSNFGFTATQMYDLKGVMRRRYLDPNDVSNDLQTRVLPDGNFMDRIPVPIREDELAVFSEAVARDVEFLVNVDVIDYSLLLSFDDNTRELRASVIDYLHQYDFLKKVESSAKTMYTTPTVIPPEAYERRFLDAMHRYFVGIPDTVILRNGSDPQIRPLSGKRHIRALSDRSNGDQVVLVGAKSHNEVAEDR